jgi:hypothetical protein
MGEELERIGMSHAAGLGEREPFGKCRDIWPSFSAGCVVAFGARPLDEAQER